jgi:hypothetical protein
MSFKQMWVSLACGLTFLGCVDGSVKAPVASPGLESEPPKACPIASDANRVLGRVDDPSCACVPGPDGDSRFSDPSCVCPPSGCPSSVVDAISVAAEFCKPTLSDLDYGISPGHTPIYRREGCGAIEVAWQHAITEHYLYSSTSGELIGAATSWNGCALPRCRSIAGKPPLSLTCPSATVCRLCGASSDGIRPCPTSFLCGIDVTTPIDKRLFHPDASVR